MSVYILFELRLQDPDNPTGWFVVEIAPDREKRHGYYDYQGARTNYYLFRECVSNEKKYIYVVHSMYYLFFILRLKYESEMNGK